MAAWKTKRYLLQMTFVAAALCLVRAAIPRRVLLLGGNGMIGSAVAERLLADGHHLTLVNRGNWRWGTDTLLKPRVKFIYCDRNFIEEQCKGLFFSSVYDVAIDFSTYREDQMQSILEVLQNRVMQYVYMSTDSVYEVSPRGNSRTSSVEEDAPGPEEADLVTFEDSYGREKLLAEHVLLRWEGDGKEEEKEILLSQRVVLRLPDVIGPRDRTLRWWSYQLWLQAYLLLEQPLHIPPHLEGVGMSFVHVDDIAGLISNLVVNGDDNERALAKSGIFNLAIRETLTLQDFLSRVGACVGVEDVQFSEGPIQLFPSVSRGPVDSSKAELALGWSPASLDTLICQTCQFYSEASLAFPEEFERVVNYLSKLLANGSEGNEQFEHFKTVLLKFAVKKSSRNVRIVQKKETIKTEL